MHIRIISGVLRIVIRLGQGCGNIRHNICLGVNPQNLRDQHPNVLSTSSLSATITLDLFKAVNNLGLLLVLEASTFSITFVAAEPSSFIPTLGSMLIGSRYKLVMDMSLLTPVGGSGSFILFAVMEGVKEILTLVGLLFLEKKVLAFLMGVAWIGTIKRGTTSLMTLERSNSMPTLLGFACSLEDLLGVKPKGYEILVER